MNAFHTLRVRNSEKFALSDFELFTLAISALKWREFNDSIKLITDNFGAEYMRNRGLSEVWNDTEILLDEMARLNINEEVFWAGGKIYALSKQNATCVIMDLDFILWKFIEFDRFSKDLAVIHREDIYEPVYPSKESFHFVDGWSLPDWLDWSARPCNGALVYFGSDCFIKEYTSFALEFMQKANEKSDRLSYMVFAEQRWMAMCAERLNVPIHELSSLEGLFGGKQKYFTHIWGYKQKLRDNPNEAQNFCKKCSERLRYDFPDFALKLKNYEWAAKYF